MFNYSTANAANSANAAYNSQSNALATPRELGATERLCGLRSGLGDLTARLRSLVDRMEGNGESAACTQSPPSTGLLGVIGDSEELLRQSLALIHVLDGKL